MEEFLSESVNYLENHYYLKIRRCMNELNDEEVWWRPNNESNSIGNIAVHLCGNLRQWIISGVGNKKDIRVRDREFNESYIPKEELMELLSTTIKEAKEVLTRVDVKQLLERRVIQGSEVNLFQAIFHAIEHFSMHTGQIIYITKMIKNKNLEFYIFEDGRPIYNWQKN
jgi:uncharacterized damage-inducible protein DinB